MAEIPSPSAPWFSPFSDKLPSPMVHDDGVAELVLESGQLLARRPRSGLRLISSARLSCPSRLDKLDTQCDEDDQDEEEDRQVKRPRAAEEQHMWIDSHLVPEYRDTAEQDLNNDIIPKVPDNHHQVQHNVGWGPIGGRHPQQPDQNEPRLHNFTNFLRPSRLLRPDGSQRTNSCSTSSTNGPNSSARLDRLMQRQSSASGKTPPVESTLVESGSRSVKALGNQLGLLATGGATGAVSLGDDDTIAKRCPADQRAKDENPEQAGANNTSVCSLAASNNLDRLNGRHEANSNGEQGRKRKRRSAEIHSQSEKKRRAKINKKLSMLQDLIPNANRVDKASLLDDAIEYLKTLQLQLQMMAMGRGLMMHPMMLPGMQPPQMAQPPSIGMGMGMGMNMPMGGLGCIPNPFPPSPVLGLPGQMLPVSMSPLQPFGHLQTGGSSSNPLIPMPSAVDLLGSAPMMGAVQNINPEFMNIDHKKVG
ncbi:Transcription factor PHYTOCHROME INTERACTING FACTOR-LIKE 15 [Linum grandiflorum]